MQLTHQFQGQTVKDQGYRWAGAYRVGRTWWPHCLFEMLLYRYVISYNVVFVVVDALTYVKSASDFHWWGGRNNISCIRVLSRPQSSHLNI